MSTETAESASNIQNDPVEEFLAGLARKEDNNDPPKDDSSEPKDTGEAPDAQGDDKAGQGTEAAPPAEETPPVGELDIDKLDTEKQLKVFNKLTGLNVSSVDDISKIKGAYEQLPELQKKLEIYPTLLEKLKASQDIMSYFPNEAAYKVAQLLKRDEFKGKEAELTRLLNSDVSTLNTMEVVKLYSTLNAPDGVKNPLRYMITKLHLDPDEVINNFDELTEDQQDLFNGFAAESRKALSKIGNDIEVPASNSQDIENLLQSITSSSKDDLEKKRTEIMPVSKELVSKVTEIPVLDDFKFKLEMSEADRDGYAEFLTQAILSGDFNVSTDEGKQELFDALMDEIWVDNRKKIIKAHDTYLREKYDREFREKYDNAAPLNKNTPPPANPKTPTNPFVDVIEKMVEERL